ncbi:hypothetical protein [Microvirga splendida]|uniref:Uncharacterized protein n=1 Tax=Microvirga splendida TaxID=2795727 RepID=A0ABS0XUV2_9HYPH|nr:hypothetical protein [Microvirga splendida]MBJ6123797.1 hypothetical protein [Microvirga splendida]
MSLGQGSQKIDHEQWNGSHAGPSLGRASFLFVTSVSTLIGASLLLASI